MEPVERKIYYLKVACKRQDFGDILKQIDGLQGASMYSFKSSNGGGIYLQSLRHSNDMYQGVIGRFRMTGFPSVTRRGERLMQALSLAEDQGLVEVTHFIYFAQSQILAIEHNYLGPRASTLEWHLIEKMNEQQGEPLGLQFQEIFDEDTLRLLDEESEIRLLQLSVPKTKIGNLAAFDASIHAAFENAAHFGEQGEVELVLRFARQRRKNDRLPTFPGSAMLTRLQNIAGSPKDTFSKLKVRVKPAPDEAMQTVDLLQNKLVSTVQVAVTGRGRQVDSEQMFRLMQEAYQEQRQTLARLSEYEPVA